MRQAKNVIRRVGNAAAALSVLFVLYTLVQLDLDWGAVKDVRGLWAVCAAGVALKMASVLLMGLSWCLWLEFLSGRICDRREALRIYVKANLGKYLPGNVMHYVERNLFAETLGLEGTQIALASVCEVVILVAAAVLLAVLFGYEGLKEAVRAVMQAEPVFRSLTVWVVPGVLVVGGLVLACVHKWPGLALQFGKSLVLEGCVLVLLGIILAGLYACLYQRPDIHTGRLLISAYIIAWMLGFLVPGASGGIGVRELVLTLVLTPVTGRDAIVLLGVLHRLITVAGDFALYILWNVVRKVRDEDRIGRLS